MIRWIVCDVCLAKSDSVTGMMDHMLIEHTHVVQKTEMPNSLKPSKN